MKGAYYNEIEPFCVEWLRNLIKAGHIAPGDVDDRSIADVRPEDLRGYAQCHFFAGLGAWSHALRQAGVADDQPLWTGSAPCQPFSAAGRGKGFADERHLWPVWADLIRECRPPVIFGEQVASKAALDWLDVVFADLEDQDYTCGAADLCAAGSGAPHLRQRLFWVAHAGEQRREGVRLRLQPGRPLEGGAEAAGGGPAGGGDVADACSPRHDGSEDARTDSPRQGESAQEIDRRPAGVQQPERDRSVGVVADAERGGGGARGAGQEGRGSAVEPDRLGAVGLLADTALNRPEGHSLGGGGDQGDSTPGGAGAGPVAGRLLGHPGGEGLAERPQPDERPGALRIEGPAAAEAGVVGGFWRDADLIWCTDGRYRAVEPDTFPLSHGSPARVGRLRAYGNAIVAPVATEFIKAFLDTMP